MIEDDLRTLLIDRAADLPVRPGRVTDVRSRIDRVRRRRAVGTLAAVVLVAAAGLGLTRLPGPAPTTAGLPAPPFFADPGRPEAPGWDLAFVQQLTGPTVRDVVTLPYRSLLLVRCEQPGDLVVRNLGIGATATASCTEREGDHYEGLVVIEPELAARLFDAGAGVRFEPGSSGRWALAVYRALAPDRLRDPAGLDPPLAQGAGTTVAFTVPSRSVTGGFTISAECVEGVRLELSVPRGRLAELVCDEAHGLRIGGVSTRVTKEDLARVGLRPGERTELTIRSVGRSTDQWRVLSGPS